MENLIDPINVLGSLVENYLVFSMSEPGNTSIYLALLHEGIFPSMKREDNGPWKVFYSCLTKYNYKSLA